MFMIKSKIGKWKLQSNEGGFIFCICCLLTLLVCSNAGAFKLPDTGQTTCYGIDGNETSCAGTGQDGEYNINPLSYTDNGDGTVTDNNTGLMWQKCSAGQTDDATCSGSATASNWYQAYGTPDATYNPEPHQDVCGSLTLGGHSDWRLPSKKEIMNIVDYGVPYPGPTIEQTYFPNTVAGGTSLYWTSLTFVGDTSSAWYTTFDYGAVYHASKASSYYVRCVRGEQSDEKFKDNGNGTVTDNRTGLIWQKKEASGMPWANSIAYCEGLSLGGHSDWRLPNAKELESLTDDSHYNPAINSSFFPTANNKRHWTSTSLASGPTDAWYVSFYDGTLWESSKATYYDVRCVRGGSTVSDTTPPTATLMVGSFVNPRKVNITLTAVDNVGGSGVAAYKVTLTSTPPSKSAATWKAVAPKTFTFPATATSRPVTLHGWAKDKAGNVSASSDAVVNLDVTKPVVTAFTAKATNPASGTVNVSITANDPVVNTVASGASAYMVTKTNVAPPASSPNWINGATSPTSVTFPATVKAGATLFAWVKDANGNVSKSMSAKVAAGALAVPATQQAQPLQRAQATAASTGQAGATMAGAPQAVTPDASAGMTIWEGVWFKLTIKNMGYYNAQSGLSGDRQQTPGYLKIVEWDPDQQTFESDFYQYDSQTDQWLSQTIVLNDVSGTDLDYKVSCQTSGEFTFAFTARIRGQESGGNLTEASFRTLGGYHLQENNMSGMVKHHAGWLVIAGKMVPESEVMIPAANLLP
jgi:hypothetical protein